jgi:hypothetical protein
VSALLRIETLAGDGRYAVTFRRVDGSEQAAVVQVCGDDVSAAEASLPQGWTRGSEAFRALVGAVLALHRARSTGPRTVALYDVEGGWDVMLGNVVLGDDGAPSCTAHGTMTAAAQDVWECAECGARAAYAA